MSRVACRYAIIRFMPYVETGEFANVGIVLACPATGFFGFKLQDRRYRRVTQFFEHIEARDYTQALRLFRDELNRIQDLAATAGHHADKAGFVRGLFERLVHPREAVIQFGEARAIMADDPVAVMNDLFLRHVEHDFGERGNREQSLVRNVQEVIQQLNLALPFRPAPIGNGDLHANFPLVQMLEGMEKPLKVIKPFFLAQEAANEIRDHAGNWIYKLTKMRAQGLLPAEVMFPVQGPTDMDSLRYMAFRDVVQDLEQLDIRVVAAGHLQEIRAFAQG